MNRKNLIKRLLWRKQSKGTLYLASIGMLIGFFILFISIESYFALNSIFKNDKELFIKDYLVINKKISLLNTISFVNASFSDKEIEEIKGKPFVKELGLITTNQFKVGAFTDGNEELPPFYAELFFESVPEKFIDISTSEWQWNPENAFIPIILPRDYLKLYNFGFAQSQNLPQISEEMAGKAMADFIIEGGGRKLKMKGKIVGFTDRINSILVPEKFMIWANKNYGRYNEKKDASRIILVCHDPLDPELSKFLDENNYETNTQQTKGSRLNNLLQLIISFILFIGVVIVVLAFIVFFSSFQLMISKSQNTIRKLILIGYHHLYIAKLYALIYAFLISLIYAISLIGVFTFKLFLVNVLKEINFNISEGLSLGLGLTSFSVVVILLIINSLYITRQLRKLV